MVHQKSMSGSLSGRSSSSLLYGTSQSMGETVEGGQQKENFGDWLAFRGVRTVVFFTSAKLLKYKLLPYKSIPTQNTLYNNFHICCWCCCREIKQYVCTYIYIYIYIYIYTWSERNIIRVIRGEDDVGGGVGRAPEWGQDQRLSHCS